jgi:ABC-type uncharacterized transport system ATPase subunit
MRVELQGIHKYYGSVKANNGITMTVRPGTIHGVLGENGAGKSTLMKVLAGYAGRTDGTILVNGRAEDYASPAEAARLGIGMLYQEPLDYPTLSVLENFMIGQTGGLACRQGFFRQRLCELNRNFRFSLHPDTRVDRLTVGERQQLEILRLIALGIELLILDEPTTGISKEQKDTLFAALRKLAAEGKSVIMVSHKLQEAEALCDEVMVLRDGRVAGSMEQPYEADRLLKMMFKVPPAAPARTAVAYGETILSMTGVSGLGGRSGLFDCTMKARQGEMIGLAGLEGSGQGVFLRLACGLTRPRSGRIELFGDPVHGKSSHIFREKGVVFLPTSRLEEGLMPGLSITEHFALQDKHPGVLVRWRNAMETASSRIQKFRVIGTPETTVENLSGGNQQRLLLSLLSKESTLLLLEHPTRGLDVESAQWVWQHLHKYCSRKTGIIFSSADLDEIMTISDRIIVFFDGRIVMDVKKEDADVNEISRAMAGNT